MFDREKPPIEDPMIVQAIRERILDEIKHKHGDAHSIVNNVYGGSLGHPGGGGVMAGLGGENSPDSVDPREQYFVDILKENLDPNDPKKGWKKSVRRYTQRDGDDLKKKEPQ